MAFYHRAGLVAPRRHTAFRDSDGNLYREELFSSRGFDGAYSLKYHIHSPSQTLSITPTTRFQEFDEETANEGEPKNAPLNFYHFNTDQDPPGGDFVSARRTLLSNDSIRLGVAHINQVCDFFYRNAGAHELLFVREGRGRLISEYGDIAFSGGDYLLVPKSVVYRLEHALSENIVLFYMESDTAFEIPSHYRNEHGQLLESAPYYERDFRPPAFRSPLNEAGNFELFIKRGKNYFKALLPHHPFDLVGWDGFLYPFAFNIRDFAPRTGRLHLPPPVHMIFKTRDAVICNFTPRLFDFDPEAIPAPYYHSNIDSDEVLYYVEGNFMSRKGVSPGSLTLHPAGIAHGPQPGKTEESIGKKETQEYAVMVDTFAPLYPGSFALKRAYKNYEKSWLEAET